jgi:hypothetical protein
MRAHERTTKRRRQSRRVAARYLMAASGIGALAVATLALLKGSPAWLVEAWKLTTAILRWFGPNWPAAFGVAGAVVVPFVIYWLQRRHAVRDARAEHRQKLRERQATITQEQDAQVQQADVEAQAKRRDWDATCRRVLVRWPLPGVANADPYELGVFESTRADAYRRGGGRPPYVPRVTDKRLAELLVDQHLVLVSGQSRAGKSRSAFEVAVQVLPNHQLVAPRDRTSLVELAELDPSPWQDSPALLSSEELSRE